MRAGDVSILIDISGRLPRICYWGADLGELSESETEAVVLAGERAVTSGTTDDPYQLSIVPEASAGWLGTPGISGHREGRGFSTAFRMTDCRVIEGGVVDIADGAGRDGAGPGGQLAPSTVPADDCALPAGAAAEGTPVAATVIVTASDDVAELDLTWTLQLFPSGLVRARTAVTSRGRGVFDLSTLDCVFPIGREAREILDFTGRHLRERSPQRHDFTAGTHLRETRRGRTHDGTIILLAGTPGFGYQSGEVWGVHTAWSGNLRTFAEQVMPSGERVLGGGELLLAGEVRLGAGESYASPWVYASYGNGVNKVSDRFHRFLRSRPEHPTSARKSLINVWEAVYFDHDLEQLTALADAAARVGLERYVLDDGWFRHRRSDDAGLGDWYVDETVWPDGLHPIVDHVTGLGLEFGLWFEPEMINEDSDVAREHPEWILRTVSRMPMRARNQQVLDLTNPEAWQYIYDRMHAILSEYRIGFVKWDHNRDVFDAGRQATDSAGVHEQTRATYRLLRALRTAHPGVEFESCAGGGGRIDLGILALTDRVWTSDCIDPLERQTIEAGTGIVVPPELLGSHIASPRSHTTGRRHDLSFRGATAMFGHLGVEWDLTSASAEDLTELARWVAAYRANRELLHSGAVVRIDDPDPALRVHGVVAPDASEAIYALVQVATSVAAPPGMVRLAGLDENRTYRVAALAPGNEVESPTPAWQPAWWWSGVTLSGRVLAHSGVQAPTQYPEHTVLLKAVAID